MNLFNRALRLFLIITAVISSGIAACAWIFSRLILSPPAVPIPSPNQSSTPLPLEEVHFPASQDGLRISGWFLPQKRGKKSPVMILVHGWPWNRTGEDRKDWLGNLIKAEKVDLLKLAHDFHKDGYGVLLYDMRNHGESASTNGGVTFGVTEALDLLGAINWLGTRSDTDMEKIGVTGFSMGANTALFAATHTDRIKAIAAVQPTTPLLFARRFATYLTGPFGMPVVWLGNFFVKLFGGMPLEDIDLMSAVPHIKDTPILYLQGAGDPFGSVDDVQSMGAVTPELVDVIIATETDSRYAGYTYAVEHPEIVLSYFRDYLNR